MNSRFYYPTNTGSLGEPRRIRSFLAEDRGFPFGPGHRLTIVREGKTVLVVEPDDKSLFLLKDTLTNNGYHVLQAYDGKQALAIAETERLDLILLAHQLPGMDGLGVLRHLRADANLESQPIVIMMGAHPESYREKAIAAGCDDFLLRQLILIAWTQSSIISFRTKLHPVRQSKSIPWFFCEQATKRSGREECYGEVREESIRED